MSGEWGSDIELLWGVYLLRMLLFRKWTFLCPPINALDYVMPVDLSLPYRTVFLCTYKQRGLRNGAVRLYGPLSDALFHQEV